MINSTGVIIHTNLGRTPISKKILSDLAENLSGYTNLEFHLPTQKRGKRGGFAEELVCDLTGAEDALIVNNNASSVFLILSAFAKDMEVVVSRGELIQIGGGFRIPDIMKQSGAKLIEVGTTNITELDDYKNAINENTSMIFSAHQSNYKIEGFAKLPSLKELATLKSDNIKFVRDLGSGNFVNDSKLPADFEPTVRQEIAQGADLVCFSGDKLLGACQAGIIVGKSEQIAQLRKHPLMRMIRVDKITYYLLQETLLKYDQNIYEELSLWEIIYQTQDNIKKRINKVLKKVENKEIKKTISQVSLKSTYGGGTLPTIELDSFGIQIDIDKSNPEKIYNYFINAKIPIVGVIVNDKFTMNFMTVFDKDIDEIAEVLNLLRKDLEI